MQDNHVIYYKSRKLKDHEKNYVTHDSELVAIVHALKMWRNYLTRRKFDPRTDHYGLKYLFDQPNLNVGEARWLYFLCEFDFEIKHIKWCRWVDHNQPQPAPLGSSGSYT